MKRILSIIMLVGCVGLFSCKKVIGLYPQSNLSTGTYYTNYDEVKAALSGCYNGMQRPLLYEWQLTELRSDNSKQGQPGSTASTNRDLSDLDMFTLATTHQAIYQYWLSTYNNIRNCNIVIQKLGAVYDPASGSNSLKPIDIPITETDRKQLVGEAMFIRAYHYFNLVRLFGGVFLVYEAITNYANVFSISNEVNEEILFTVRFKAGGLGLGSSFANTFAPLQSGNAVVNEMAMD